MVLSEVYYPAWRAYVDGRPAPVLVADGLLRAVEVPAGEHEVEFRYESWALWAGIAVSAAAYAVEAPHSRSQNAFSDPRDRWAA